MLQITKQQLIELIKSASWSFLKSPSYSLLFLQKRYLKVRYIRRIETLNLRIISCFVRSMLEFELNLVNFELLWLFKKNETVFRYNMEQ